MKSILFCTLLLLLPLMAFADQAVVNFTIVIDPAPITIVPWSGPDPVMGVSYGPVPLQISGGVPPYNCDDKGTLPTGMNVTNCAVGGIPATYCFINIAPLCTQTTITVTDANHNAPTKPSKPVAPSKPAK